MDLAKSLEDKKMGKKPETRDAEDALSPKGGLPGWIIRHIRNAGPIQKHNDALREAQTAALRG